MRTLMAALVLLAPNALAAQQMVSEKPLQRFGTTNLRHCSPTFAFAPDSSAIAAVSTADNTSVLIHDCRTGALLAKLDVGAAANALSFSPDGKRLLASSSKGQTTVLEAATGKKLATLKGHSACFADQGRKIVTVLTVGEVERIQALYDAGTLVQIAKVETSVRAVFSRDLEPTHSAREADGKWILATHPDGKTVTTFAGGERPRFGQFHQDGQWFIFSNADGIHVWNVKTGKEIRSIAGRADSPVVVSADGKQLAWSGFDPHDGIAFVWVCDLVDGKPRHVGAPTNEFYAPLFSPDGKTLACRTDAGVLVLRDVVTGKDCIEAQGHTGRVARVHFTADARHLVSRDRDAILVWELKTGKCAQRFPHDLPAGEQPIVGTLAKDFVITVASDGTLRQRQLITGHELRVLAGKHGYVFGAALPAAVSADAAVVAVVSKDYHIRAYELATGKILLDFDTPCAVWDVFLSPGGRYLSWISQNHPQGDGVHYLDVMTGKEMERQQLPPTAFPLGNEVERWLPVADLGPRLTDLKLGRLGSVLLADGPQLNHVRLALSRDGRFVLARTLDRTGPPGDDLGGDLREEIGSLKVWEIASGRMLPPLVVRRDATEVAALSPDGRMLVTTTYCGSIHLWELATGGQRCVLAGHHEAVYAIAFSADGRYLASGGGDAQVLLWDLCRH
jgi:WD40 repeat protein